MIKLGSDYILSKLYFVLFILSLILISVNVFIFLKGFYFSGDTVTYLESAMAARRGDLLTTFRWSYNVWTPGLPFIFNFLRFLPISFVSQHQLFVFTTLILNILISFLIAKKITQSKILQSISIGLILFGGVHAFLYQVATSESLFIFSWLLIIYALLNFMITQKERYILLFIIAGWLLTFTRYAGIWVLIGFIPAVLLYTILVKRRNYSIGLIITTLILVWVPITLYLIRNWILSNTFIGVWDKQFVGVTYLSIITNLAGKMISDLSLPFIGSLLLGMRVAWNNKTKYLLYLSGFSVVIYFVTLAWTQTNIRMYDGFGSRYLGVSYPAMFMIGIALGSYFIKRFAKLKNFYLITPVILILILGNQIIISSKNIWQQVKSKQSVIVGVEYSQNIRDFCRGKTRNKYIFIQGSSRNWVGQSLYRYCQPINYISSDLDEVLLPKGALLYTPYEFTVSDLDKTDYYNGEKKVNLYKASRELKLSIKEKIKELNNPLN